MLPTGYSRVGFPNSYLQTPPRSRQSSLHFGVNDPSSSKTIKPSQHAQADQELLQLFSFEFCDPTVRSIDLQKLQEIVKKGPSEKALTQMLNKVCAARFEQPELQPEQRLEQQFEAIKILVKAGADVNAKAMQTEDRVDPKDWWVSFSPGGKNRITPLLSSVCRSIVDFKIVKLLLDAGADPRRKDHKARNALEIVQEKRPRLRMKSDEAIVKRSDQQYEQNLLKLEKLLKRHIAQRDWNEMNLTQKCKTGVLNILTFVETKLSTYYLRRHITNGTRHRSHS